MNFLKQLAGLFSGRPGGSSRYLPIYVLSHRCNEPIAGQVDLFNELSRGDDESDHAYFTRKGLHTSGANRCFAQVEVHLYFDRNKQLVDHEVEGGRWLTIDEYEDELARFQAPPEEEPEDESEKKSAGVDPAAGDQATSTGADESADESKTENKREEP